MTFRLSRVFAVFCLMLGLAVPAWGISFPKDTLRIETRQGAVHHFHIEIARTPQQLQQGLMFRAALAPNAGMLFLFPNADLQRMWMKNTRIPLDMLFIDAAGRIAFIEERTMPGSLRPISAPRPVIAVLELNGGTSQALGIQAGDSVRHPAFKEERP